MPKYHIDDDFKLRVKMLAALAFVPVSDVVANFEYLDTTFLNDELPLLSFFESTWIGQSVGGRRLPTMFSGGGGGGFRPITLEKKMYFELGVGG